MNLIGKILTVMIAVMSILFMSFTLMTYMTHRNWQKQAKSMEQKFANATTQIQDKESEIARIKLELSQEKAARTQAISALEDTNRDLKEKLTDEQIKRTNEQAEKGRSIQNAETAQAEMLRLKDELSIVRETLKKTLDDRNQKLAQVTDLTNRLNQSQTQLAQSREQGKALRTQLSRAKLVLDRNNLDEFTPVDNIPPDLDGIVTRVRESDLVEVSLGADEGLRRGHKLEIYRRDGSYIGRVEVVDTGPDRSVGRIIPDFLQGTIRKGDHVATKLL